MKQWLCPKCGFRVLNRAYPKCERCGAILPSDIRLSKEEIAANWKETTKGETNDKLNDLSSPGDIAGGLSPD